MTFHLKLLFVLVLFAGLSGCGQRLLPVRGRVTLAGQPVTKGHIWLVPDLEKGQTHTQFSICALDADGRFELATYGKDGVPLGWYKVVVYATKTEPPSSPTGWTPDFIVPIKYTDPNQSDLRVEVVAEPAPGAYDFDLKP